MTYEETCEYLYNQMPMFERQGASGYKEGLSNTLALDEYLGHPHQAYKTIHVGGTNGKGSVSHTIASVLQECGYRVGLYTSPHLIDFRERIRINGKPISQQYVIEFVEKYRSFFAPLHPSFFEVTTAMAFQYFKERNIDIAVVEVGLGGRLDCTNIITPDLSIITNISLEHTQFLGNTLAKIAGEKTGIIKQGVPVVIGETTPETKPVFLQKVQEMKAPIYFAEENGRADFEGISPELQGNYQQKNTRTIVTALTILRDLGYRFDGPMVRQGFAHVTELTGLMGRWQTLSKSPTLVCDTGHNVGGYQYIAAQLKAQHCRKLHIVIGVVSDKDVKGMLALLPQEAVYYFTKASVKRALNERDLQSVAEEVGLHGEVYPDVVSAVKAAQKNSLPEDFIFVGGSNFIVADLLEGGDALNLDKRILR